MSVALVIKKKKRNETCLKALVLKHCQLKLIVRGKTNAMENSLIAKSFFYKELSSILLHSPSLNSKYFASLNAFVTFLGGRGIPLVFILQMES